MRDTKLYKLFLIILFCLLIILPEVDRRVNIFSFIQNRENRVKEQAPAFSAASIDEFMKNYNSYYEVNFGMRDIYFWAYSHLKYFVLKTSPLPEYLVLGENGWFYLGNRYSNVIDEAMDKSKLTSEELDRIAKFIEKRVNWMKPMGIKYFVCIAPNKETIYYNYLPEWCRPDHYSAKVSTISDHLLKKINFEIVDLKNQILNHKNVTRLYHKSNSHWNGLGAFWGYYELIIRLKKDYPELKPFDYSDVILDSTFTKYEDLVTMINIGLVELRINAYPKDDFKALRIENKLAVPKITSGNIKNHEIRYENPNANLDLKVLVFRDSFFTELIPWFSEHFTETVFISSDYNKNIILKEKPDIVIHEIVERNFERRFKIRDHK